MVYAAEHGGLCLKGWGGFGVHQRSQQFLDCHCREIHMGVHGLYAGDALMQLAHTPVAPFVPCEPHA